MMAMLPKKPVIKPSVKMRGFMWKKLKTTKDTIWEDADDEKVPINLKELEELFCQSKPKPKVEAGEGGEEKKKKSNKPTTVSLLDMKRSQNLSIMLSRFGKLEFNEIRDAILKLDEEVLTPENTTALKNFAPDADEIGMIKDYGGDVAQLGKPERFVLAIADVPRLVPRLTCLSIKQGFTPKYEAAEAAVGVIGKAIKEIDGNKRLKEMLEIVLALGNHMNGGTGRGGAWGFAIESLVKMTDVKSVDGSQTMMNYLAQYVEDKFPQLADLPEDFPSLSDACRESMPQIDADINKLQGEVNTVLKAVETAPDSPSDPFKAKMGPFATKAQKEIEGCAAKMQAVKNDFASLAKYFGENPKTDSQSFFESLHRFVTNFEKAKKDNKRRKTLAEKAKLAEERKKEAAAKRAAGGGGDAPAQPGGLMDNLIGDMKSGMAFSARLRSTRGRGGGGAGRGAAPPADQGGVANEALAMFGRLKKTGKR